MTPAPAPNGYTLVEMLAAMLVLGLAMTALTQATRLFAQTSRHAAVESSRAARSLAVERTLRRALGPGPYSSKGSGAEAGLQGDRTRIAFDCDAPTLCELAIQDQEPPALTLRGRGERSVPLDGRRLEFRYVVAGQPAPAYPSADDSQALEAIAIVNPQGAVLASWRPQVGQSADCAFDQVNHRCFARQGADR